MLKFFKFVVLLLILSVPENGNCKPGISKIGSSLLVTLENGGIANIFVTLEAGTGPAFKDIQSHKTKFADRSGRINNVANVLKTHAADSQAPVIKFLQENSITYKTFWVSNQIYIVNATLSLTQQLSALPQISAIAQEIVVKMERTDDKPVTQTPKVAGVQWGVSKIEADQVWNLEEGASTGEGVVVGLIDTGVRVTHQALSKNYRSTYGWLDPIFNKTEPYDDDSHGTHIMATIAGSHGVGVAPGAKYIACRGCDYWDCLQSHLIECGQFMLCPTLPDGFSSPDCSMAPHIVSNSWGFYANESFYVDVTTAWLAAGIIPFFAIGNGGPDSGCSYTGAPGNELNVIGVGATAVDDSLYTYSSHGPAPDGKTIKPDISAPGHLILSASNTSDNAYVIKSGTSMACPHVAGTAALLLQLRNNITFEEMKSYLFAGVHKDGLVGTTDTRENCGGISDAVFPNNAFGHGRLNALQSVKKLLNYSNSCTNLIHNVLGICVGMIIITLFNKLYI